MGKVSVRDVRLRLRAEDSVGLIGHACCALDCGIGSPQGDIFLNDIRIIRDVDGYTLLWPKTHSKARENVTFSVWCPMSNELERMITAAVIAAIPGETDQTPTGEQENPPPRQLREEKERKNR